MISHHGWHGDCLMLLFWLQNKFTRKKRISERKSVWVKTVLIYITRWRRLPSRSRRCIQIRKRQDCNLWWAKYRSVLSSQKKELQGQLAKSKTIKMIASLSQNKSGNLLEFGCCAGQIDCLRCRRNIWRRYSHKRKAEWIFAFVNGVDELG